MFLLRLPKCIEACKILCGFIFFFPQHPAFWKSLLLLKQSVQYRVSTEQPWQEKSHSLMLHCLEIGSFPFSSSSIFLSRANCQHIVSANHSTPCCESWLPTWIFMRIISVAQNITSPAARSYKQGSTDWQANPLLLSCVRGSHWLGMIEGCFLFVKIYFKCYLFLPSMYHIQIWIHIEFVYYCEDILLSVKGSIWSHFFLFFKYFMQKLRIK